MAWTREVGAPDALVAPALRQVADLAARVHAFGPDVRVVDRQEIAHGPWTLTALMTPGHTPAHMCFYERRSGTLFTGDHIFPLINVSPSYRPQSRPDPVGDYLASLDRLEALDVRCVLPGHQRPFSDLAARIDALRRYHRDRLADVVALAGSSATVWEVASRIHRSREWDELPDGARLTALAEAYAHLAHLEATGKVESTGEHPLRWLARR